MFDQDLITRYYAYNAFFYFFYDQNLLTPGVFGDNTTIGANQQSDIYKDRYFGMDSQFKLCNWVAASDPDNPNME